MAVTKNRSSGLSETPGSTLHKVATVSDVDEGSSLGLSVPPFLAAGLTLSLVLLGIVAYFSYRWLVQRLQSSTKPSTEQTDPEQASTSSHQQPPPDIRATPCEEKDETPPAVEGAEMPKSPSGQCYKQIYKHFLSEKTGNIYVQSSIKTEAAADIKFNPHLSVVRELNFRLPIVVLRCTIQHFIALTIRYLINKFEIFYSTQPCMSLHLQIYASVTVCNIAQRDSQAIGRIRPELYQPDMMRQWSADSGAELLGDGSEQGASCGKLMFTLRYDHDVEGLIVRVLQARDLPAKDFSGTSDPYIKIYLLPDRKKKFQTRVHRRNLNPTFNETFVFGVPYEQLRSRTIQFSVYDFDRFSRHDLIGQVLVRGLPELCDINHDVEYTMDILGVPQEKVDLGEVMLSLCYLPTAGRLTVTIIKARNLKVMDITGSSDPYVKVSLMCEGKRVKKKKTSVKKSTLNPVYNEALVFDVPAENIEDVTLVVKVIDYDRVGANEMMGCFAIGSSCIGLGRDHWIEMLDNPRKPVAQWYTLQESLSGLTVEKLPVKSSPIKCISMR
ncbi:synaptotagmin-9-like [Parasteatoda tepidariorum]|uniref:synaptotagmin-9-like n=1 Tax=Parasteatoda tepidariorum TaxID=114398 RepID=UPI0039BCBC4E